jgi:hypothetical protein
MLTDSHLDDMDEYMERMCIFEIVIGATTVALSLFVSYLIMHHSTKEMHPYKYFILIITVSAHLLTSSFVHIPLVII